MSQTIILIVAGEASGDSHGARLVAAIKKRLPEAGFSGVGGEALAGQGVEILCQASELAVVGLSEVFGRLPAVWRALRAIAKALKTNRPGLVILVDFPDFNFWVARLARWYGVPVMYYISPQVWAWRSYRVRTLARLVDRLVVIFPFEADFYRQKGLPVDFVGHPFLETLSPLPPRERLLEEWGLGPERFTLALLPGSRASEIERHLPNMLEAAKLIRKAIPEIQFILPLASTAPEGLVKSLVEGFLGEGENSRGRLSSISPGLPLKIITGQSYAALAAAHLAVVASGTATLEAALAGTPTIIVYRLAPLSYELGRRLIKVEHIGMANLLAGERLFPEILQAEFTPERLAQEVIGLVQNPKRLGALKMGLGRIINNLGGPGASARAAQVALELMEGEKDD
ncbi:MAG: lipid-A-disaccharide synthase [Deltaproteobacteria bacterium RBG_13_58_19]|nr:MAG: lipid-A-disaccharide synthase [Deltaproteobacteria bacterium RBG_13_58_19]